ncbi:MULTISPECIES: putative sporulation protein YtxC [Paenibacillus]|uniref:putative sporulation protein YtxC n=1 Tax=Paenibacillus TaxID=44249 RepID=UPI002FE19BE2
MDFFSLHMATRSLEQKRRFLNYICDEESAVHKGTARIKTYYPPDEPGMRMVLSATGKGERATDELRCQIKDDLARGISRFIVEVKEAELAGDIASKLYRFSSREEEAAVMELCARMLSGEEEGDRAAKRHRTNEIRRALTFYLEEAHYLDIDGFIEFRLRGYKDKLREMVDLAMEEYLLDQQYEEFIHLLQYFVHFQEPLTPLIHLIHKEGQEFGIYNEQFAKITPPSVGYVIAQMADQEMEMEDMVVSALISLSPQRIHIHTSHPDAQIIATISRIFGDRVQLCLQCVHCRSLRKESRPRDQGTSGS